MVLLVELPVTIHSVTVSSNVTVSKAEQPEKAEPPILATLLGISILIKLEHSQKAADLILFSCEFSPNVTVSKAEQSRKAYLYFLVVSCLQRLLFLMQSN